LQVFVNDCEGIGRFHRGNFGLEHAVRVGRLCGDLLYHIPMFINLAVFRESKYLYNGPVHIRSPSGVNMKNHVVAIREAPYYRGHTLSTGPFVLHVLLVDINMDHKHSFTYIFIHFDSNTYTASIT
jgi:hypothetical protein